MEWVCKQCGKCCISIPCVFAQAKHRITSSSESKCPELVKDGSIYKCLLIERDIEARNTLISGDCDDPALVHLKKKINGGAIVREYFPEANEDDVMYILWNHTGFPEFWNIPQDGWSPDQCLRKQLSQLVG